MRIGTLKYATKVYATAMPKIIKVALFPFLQPKVSLKLLQAMLEYEDLSKPDPVLGGIDITQLLGRRLEKPLDITLMGAWYDHLSGGTAKLLELASLAYLVKATGATRIFEIGTYVGRTTRVLAMNAGCGAEIFTLDLPQSAVEHKVGADFVGLMESGQIHQFSGDSKEFDFSPWRDSLDFCWIDGCHDYEYVLADTQAAFLMVREGGWIGWHDYRHTAWWSGVTRAVREANKRIGGGVSHLAGTTIAVVQVTATAKRSVLGNGPVPLTLI